LIKELLAPKRGTFLRLNGLDKLEISIPYEALKTIFLINGSSFITENVTNSHLIINPETYYMIINNGDKAFEIKYSLDVSNHQIIYNPYQYEHSEKVNFNPKEFKEQHTIPEGYIDILTKWYSIKFTYPDHSLIFIRPQLGISIQIHNFRSEYWKIIEGNPIIINSNNVYYFVENGVEFKNIKGDYHAVINPNKDSEKFVIIQERWSGKFDENDIKRIFNPNDYY